MPFILDTHAFAWWALDDKRLSRAAFSAIEEDQSVFVSAVTAWEISGKVRTGKWPEATELSERFFETIAHYGMIPLPITLEHAHLAGAFPGAHRDPFDRLLAAQAILDDLELVTADPAVRGFPVKVLW